MSRIVQYLLSLISIALLAFPVQVFAAEYHGEVTFNGTPVPGAVVTATQNGKTVSAVTNDVGVYSFPDLADGTWTIQIQMTGFTPLKQDVAVAPNAPPGVFSLKILSLDQIRAANKPVKVDSATALAASAPAAAAPVPNAPGGAKAANGKQPQQQAANGPSAPGPVPAPPPDPVAQQASDGLLINGSVNNAATSPFAQDQRMGNAVHGRSLYNGRFDLVLDNSALDAKQYAITGLDSPKPQYNNLQFGFNFGGALKIPHLLPPRRAPYFYIGYQRGLDTTVTTQPALVPTSAARAGDLSALPTPILAPATGLSAACLAAGVTPGKPFPGNVIPAACINPSATALLKFYPAPNLTGNPQYNYQIPLTTGAHSDQFNAFLNKGFGNKNFLNGNVFWQSQRQGSNTLFGFHDSTNVMNLSTRIGWYHRFSQRLGTNVNYQFSRSRNRSTPFFANRQDVEGQAGITGVDADPAYWGPPGLSFSSQIAGLTDANPSYNRFETNSLGGELDWNRGRHNVAIGGDFRRQEANYLQQSNPRGKFAFTGAATGITGANGSDFADFLLGIPDTSSIAYGNPDKYLRQNVYDLYARDDFRVNPEFSINAGVRWEYGSPITELKDRLVNLDIAPGFGAETPVLASNPVGATTGQHLPRSLIHPDRIGIAPIVGIAWRPISGSSLLIRSSYGIYHDTSVYQATALAMAQQYPLSLSLNLNNSVCPLTLTNAFNSCPQITPDNFAVDPGFRVGYAQMWVLSAQRDLPGSLQMVATYTGTKGTRGVQEILPNTYAYGGTNPCPSCPSGFVYRMSNGNSTREAGSILLRRRLRSGFTANVSYTFSKALDDDYSLGGQGPVQASSSSSGSGGGGSIGSSSSSSYGVSTSNGQIAQDWRNAQAQRGLSSFDQRHVLSSQIQYTTGMGLGGKAIMSGWRGALYKEWTVQASITAASGLPETPIYNQFVPGTAYTGIIRANYLGGAIHSSGTPGLFLNPNAFAIPALGQFGNARRNSITGPKQFGLNASMARNFHLHDRYNLDARLDATNVLNHVAFSNWVTAVGSPQFGAPSTAKGMRSVQATIRLRF